MAPSISHRVEQLNGFCRSLLLPLALVLVLVVAALVVAAPWLAHDEDVVTIAFLAEDNAASTQSEFLARAIHNEIELVRRLALTGKSRSVGNGDASYSPEVSFEFQGLSVARLDRLWAWWMPDAGRRVTVYLSHTGPQRSLLITMDGEKTVAIPVGAGGFTEAARRAAYLILERTDPYLLARRLTQTDEVDYLRVLELLSRVLSNQDPKDDFWAINLWGNVLMRLGQAERAMQKYAEAAELAGDRSDRWAIVQNNRASALRLMGKQDEALAILAAPRVRSHYHAYVNIGLIHLDRNEPKLAKENLLKAAAENPYDPAVQLSLGVVLYMNQDYLKSVEHLMRAYYTYVEIGNVAKARGALRFAGLAHEKLQDIGIAASLYQLGAEHFEATAAGDQFTRYRQQLLEPEP